jgi:SPP1 gp7 family putative phage head morphogenesis protein
MKQAPPVIMVDAYYKQIEKEINRIFLDGIYKEIAFLIKVSRGSILNNISDPLFKAVVDGKVDYTDGVFTGFFNSQISKRLIKLGAKYSKGKWYLAKELVPPDIFMAVAQADLKYKKIASQITTVLDDLNIQKSINDSALNGEYFKTVSEMEDAFKKTLSKVTVAPQMTIEARKMIADQWSNNLKLYIKDFADEEILKLREQVQKLAMAGNRAEYIAKVIKDSYGVSKNKAKFLAKQESSLLLAKMREERYTSVGAVKYKWSGSMDARERQDHKDLEGKIFFFDSPPVVDKATGRRANPSEDFGCRCVAIPIFDE